MKNKQTIGKFDSAITWENLVNREPKLLTLLCEALAVRDDKCQPYFCANQIWYHHFKPRLVELVGCNARIKDGVVNTSQAYNIAYHVIYNALPNCRNCWCM